MSTCYEAKLKSYCLHVVVLLISAVWKIYLYRKKKYLFASQGRKVRWHFPLSQLTCVTLKGQRPSYLFRRKLFYLLIQSGARRQSIQNTYKNCGNRTRFA